MWFQGPTVGAATTRVFSITVIGGGLVVMVNTGVGFWDGPNFPASGGVAIANAVMVSIATALVVVAGFAWRKKGRSRRDYSDQRPVYDKWFLLAFMKPWLALLVVASISALCHFYARGAAVPVEVLLYVLGGATVIWLVVIGPIWRPMNVLLAVARGRSFPLEGRSWLSTPRPLPSRNNIFAVDNSSVGEGGGEAEATPSIDKIRTVEFHTALRGYAVGDVDGYLADLATETDALQDRLRLASERIASLEKELAQVRSAEPVEAPKRVVDPMF